MDFKSIIAGTCLSVASYCASPAQGQMSIDTDLSSTEDSFFHEVQPPSLAKHLYGVLSSLDATALPSNIGDYRKIDYGSISVISVDVILKDLKYSLQFWTYSDDDTKNYVFLDVDYPSLNAIGPSYFRDDGLDGIVDRVHSNGHNVNYTTALERISRYVAKFPVD